MTKDNLRSYDKHAKFGKKSELELMFYSYTLFTFGFNSWKVATITKIKKNPNATYNSIRHIDI